MTRYAVYFAPAAGDPLWSLGSSIIGYDAATGVDLPSPADVPFRPDEWRAMTEAPRRYGFHATLKAPFELADGALETDFLSAARTLASARPAVAVAGWRVAVLGGFAALVPAAEIADVRDLADACVRDLDAFRAPLTAADRERRLRVPLPERQVAQLDRWGYPYVFDDFRFHMTLTGVLADALHEPVRLALGRLLNPLAGPSTIDAVSIFRQDDRASRFRLVSRCPLGD